MRKVEFSQTKSNGDLTLPLSNINATIFLFNYIILNANLLFIKLCST